MMTKLRRTVCTVLLGLPVAVECSAQTGEVARAIVAAKPPPGVQLVDISRDYADALAGIGKSINEQDLGAAAEGLYSLLMAEKAHLHPHWSDRARFVSSIEAAARLLREFPGESIESYAKLHDVAAETRFRKVRDGSNAEELLRTARLYPLTPHGAKSLEVYGQLTFDRGEFLAAGYAWETLYRVGESLKRPQALAAAKAAAAYHLGGETARAKAMLALLEGHGRPTGTVAGRKVSLVDMVRRSLTRKRTAAAVTAVERATWPSTYGSADSTAVMSPCAVSGLSLWNQAEAARLAGVDAVLQRTGDKTPRFGAVNLQVKIKSGRANVRLETPGQIGTVFDLPAMLHPIVLENAVVCRREQDLLALDPRTGKELWRVSDFPVHDTTAVGKTRNHYVALAGDMGRHTATFADGLVYAVGNFRATAPGTGAGDVPSEADSCSLIAVSAADGGVAWRVGRGEGDSASVKEARYLTAPTCHDGRLFVVCKVGSRYRLLCLDARTGAMLWESNLGPIPTHSGGRLAWQTRYAMELLTERAGPVAVSRGRVYLTTNSGLVAAFSSDKGTPLWAYHYPSTVSGDARSATDRDTSTLAFQVAAARKPFPPQNPVVAVRGRILSLPCDSPALLAMHELTGELLWAAPRKGAKYLAAIDANRVLLCDPGLTVISVDDGSVLKHIEVEMSDRPAVTTEAIVASGRDGLVRVSLADYSVETKPVDNSNAALGTLVIGGGKLVAANAGGLSVFAGFEEAWASLGRRIEETKDAAEAANLHLQRGVFALQSKQLDLARKELDIALAKSRESKSEETLRQVKRLRYSMALARARAAKQDAEAGKLLEEAERLASTDREHVRVGAELIHHHERFGHPAEAAAAARRMAGARPLTWVIVPEHLRVSKGRLTGYAYAGAVIDRLIAEHGPAVGKPLAPCPVTGNGEHAPLYASPGGRIALLLDSDGMPLIDGHRLFAHTETGVLCLDTRKNTWDQGLLWRVSVDQDVIGGKSFGCLDGGRRRLAIVGTKELVVVDPRIGREHLRKPWPELGVEPWAVAVGDESWVVFGTASYSYTCVNVEQGVRVWRKGERLWPAMVDAGGGLFYGPRGWPGNALTYDLRTGRGICAPGILDVRKGVAYAALNEDGFLATTGDTGMLYFHAPRHASLHGSRSRALRDVEIGEAPLYEFAAFGKRFAVLVERGERRSLQFHDVAGRHTAASVRISGDGGKPCAVSHVTPAGDAAYVVCGDAIGHDREPTNPLLVALNPVDGKEIWRYAVPGVAGKSCFISRPRLLGRLISLTVRTDSAAGPVRHLLLDRDTGKPVLVYPALDAERLSQGGWIRGLAVVGERVILETDDGLLFVQGSGVRGEESGGAGGP